MSKSVNVDFVTRQIEVDTDGKEHFISAAMAAKDAEQSAFSAQNAANTAEKIATDLGLVDEAVQTAVSSAEQASNSATIASEKSDIATAKADIATTKASEASASAATATSKADAASTSATNAAQSYANSDAIATQLTEYLATKETLTAPAVDKTLLIEGAAADAKVVGKLKGDLVAYGVCETIELTDISDGYVQPDGYVNSLTSWCHTDFDIVLRPKSTIYLIGQGYQSEVAMISENTKSPNYKVPLVLSNGSLVSTYSYTNNGEFEKNISLSFFGDAEHSAYIVNSNMKYDDEIARLRTNSLGYIFEKLNPNRINDRYVAYNGKIQDNPLYFYTDIITIENGNEISVTSKDPSGDNVARVSLCNADGVITNVLNRGTIDISTFTYKATEKCYLVISGHKSSGMEIIKKYANIPNELLTDCYPSIYPSISMFDDIAVCGDSYTAGAIFNSSGTLIGENAKTRWGSVLQRMSGVNVTTYAKGGADTSTFQTWENCLPNLLSANPHELYVLCLGINDRSYLELGTIADINDDYTQNPNTFYGNYGKIIAQIKAHAPNAKIIISKVFIVSLWDGPYYEWSSKAIEEIANHFNIPFIDTADEPFFSSVYFNNSIVGGHPVAPSYSAIAKGMNKLISKCIQDNKSYFDDYYPN